MTTASSVAEGSVRTLLFDVLGTVVDERGSIAAQTAEALAGAGVGQGQARELAADWTRRHDDWIAEVRAGREPWRSSGAIRRAALQDAVGAAGLDGLTPGVLDDLALADRRLRPWPDSAAALRALAGRLTVVALSNADLAELAGISAAGGLAWHCVLSAELAGAFKPDPAVYRMALDRLGLDPEQTMMVAAHPWDLRAAARLGLRTAHIARPGEGVPEPDDDFDVSARDLADLAAILTAEVGAQ